MAHFVYPAIFYRDSEYDNFAVAFPDVNIYTDGDTMEEAYSNAQKFLLSYLDCCEQLGQIPETPSDFDDVVKETKSPNETVMLVSVDLKTKNNKGHDVQKDAHSDMFEDFENILKNDDDYSLPDA